jgi:hypothetical protein
VLEKVNQSIEVISHTPIIKQQSFKLAKYGAAFQVIPENKLDKVKRVKEQFKV